MLLVQPVLSNLHQIAMYPQPSVVMCSTQNVFQDGLKMEDRLVLIAKAHVLLTNLLKLSLLN